MDKKKITSIAIGGFDGLHLGHQALITKLEGFGALLVIDKNYSTITPSEFRCKHTHLPCFFYQLKILKELSGEEFIRKINYDFPNLKQIVVGYDFRFGKDRQNCANDISRYFAHKTTIVKEVKKDGVSVHSKVIRDMIKKAEFEKVNSFLNREYEIVAKVVKGQGIGSKKLYPTINLSNIYGFELPKPGVYAGWAKIEGKKEKAAIFTGNRVSLDGEFSVEVYILDKELDYKEEFLSIGFKKFIRENRRFEDISFFRVK